MSKLNLFLITQDEWSGYDTYDSAVVAAESEEEAKRIHPRGMYWNKEDGWNDDYTWASSPEKVTARCIADEPVLNINAGDVIIASFNAG